MVTEYLTLLFCWTVFADFQLEMFISSGSGSLICQKTLYRRRTRFYAAITLKKAASIELCQEHVCEMELCHLYSIQIHSRYNRTSSLQIAQTLLPILVWNMKCYNFRYYLMHFVGAYDIHLSWKWVRNSWPYFCLATAQSTIAEQRC